jgi:hypothetical protein
MAKDRRIACEFRAVDAVGVADDRAACNDNARAFDDVVQFGVALMCQRARCLLAVHDIDAVLVGVGDRRRRLVAIRCRYRLFERCREFGIGLVNARRTGERGRSRRWRGPAGRAGAL